MRMIWCWIAVLLFAACGSRVEYEPARFDKSPKTFASGTLCVNSDFAGVDFTVRVRDNDHAMWRGKTPRCFPVEKGGYTVTFNRTSDAEDVLESGEIQVFPGACEGAKACYESTKCLEVRDPCPLKGGDAP